MSRSPRERAHLLLLALRVRGVISPEVEADPEIVDLVAEDIGEAQEDVRSGFLSAAGDRAKDVLGGRPHYVWDWGRES